MSLQDYVRPTPTLEIAEQATTYTKNLTNSKTMADIRRAFYALLIENAILTAECNEHRAARGFNPLKTFP